MIETILITGAKGQLGSCLQEVLADYPARVLYTDVDTLDITDSVAVQRYVAEQGVRCIVNCAAMTDVDGAESNSALAEKLNTQAPEILAQAMAAVGGLLVHISTDYVFGAEQLNTPISEAHAPAPLGVYGRTKWAGEQRVIASGARYIILRTAWLYSEHGRNFAKTMLRLTAERESLRVVCDQVGTPTYAPDLAIAIAQLLTHYTPETQTTDPQEHGAIYHFTNEGVCSWYDFAVAIAEEAGHTGCTISPCLSADYPTAAARPAYSVLDKSAIKIALNSPIAHWRCSLRKCITKLKRNENYA